MTQLTLQKAEYDPETWLRCHSDDLWIYDKLIVARKLGYMCGPVGVPVPRPGVYVVRPITNTLGMGICARREYLEHDTSMLPHGMFWCEKFTGPHFSVDYVNGEQVLSVQGHRREDNPFWKWDRWEVKDVKFPYPTILKGLRDQRKINCEFIDGKLIEIHQRHNTDMDGHQEVIPVWKGEENPVMLDFAGYTYYNDPDYNRLGFWKK